MMIPDVLYQQFCQSMPVACVDLLIVDRDGRVLLLMRRNHPARGQWWFPGGRVFHSETRLQTVHRKLHEECGISATLADEVGTYEVFLDHPEQGFLSHCITTVFIVHVYGMGQITLDNQSVIYEWRTPVQWCCEELHEFVLMGLSLIEGRQG
jgi:colanic acid biosynthesis protein WcaH